MKAVFLIFFSILLKNSFAQFAIIRAADGFALVKDTADENAVSIDTLKNGEAVWFIDKNESWLNVDYVKNNEIENAFILSETITWLNAYHNIPILEQQDGRVVLGKDSIRVLLTDEAIAADDPVLNPDSVYRNPAGRSPGKPYWGTDGNLPERKYKSIEISIGKSVVKIPASGLEGLFEPNLDYTECYYDRNHGILYLVASNGDAAGAYHVLWVVKNGQYKKRYVLQGF